MSTQTAATLSEAIDAHIRDEFPGDHDTEHLTSWAVVGGYEDLERPDESAYTVAGSDKHHSTLGLLHVGTNLMSDTSDD